MKIFTHSWYWQLIQTRNMFHFWFQKVILLLLDFSTTRHFFAYLWFGFISFFIEDNKYGVALSQRKLKRILSCLTGLLELQIEQKDENTKHSFCLFRLSVFDIEQIQNKTYTSFAHHKKAIFSPQTNCYV